jgi:hypothetical protein
MTLQDKYKIFNLCSEKLYDTTLLHDKVCTHFLSNIASAKRHVLSVYASEDEHNVGQCCSSTTFEVDISTWKLF